MTTFNFGRTYSRLVDDLRPLGDSNRSLQTAIGGEFKRVSILTRDFLVYYGPQETWIALHDYVSFPGVTRAVQKFLSLYRANPVFIHWYIRTVWH